MCSREEEHQTALTHGKLRFVRISWAAFIRYQRTAVAFLLCALALSFAVEAKLAWYRPPNGVHSTDVRSAKAMPCDKRELIAAAAPLVEPHQAPACWTLLAIVTTAVAAGLIRTPESHLPPAAHPVHAGLYLSPQISFRPPPFA